MSTELDDLYLDVDRGVVLLLVGGPRDGERIAWPHLPPAIRFPGSAVASAITGAADPDPDAPLGPLIHEYGQAVDHGHPSRADDGAYRYTYRGADQW
jgi:hypothetical protein